MEARWPGTQPARRASTTGLGNTTAYLKLLCSANLGYRHFGMEEAKTKTIHSVLGYTPNVPHWGWNGNARRYWDFV